MTHPGNTTYARRKAAGLCIQCEKPTNGKVRCDKCAMETGAKRRHMPRSEWDKIDFTRCVQDIAAETGMPANTIRNQIIWRGLEPVPCPHTLELWKMIHGLRREIEELKQPTTNKV